MTTEQMRAEHARLVAKFKALHEAMLKEATKAKQGQTRQP